MQECKVFEEVLTVRCAKSRLRIKVKGDGIAPAVKVSQALPSLQSCPT